jgi:predicted nucleic acid-binding protein
LLPIEITNIIRQRMRRRSLTAEEAHEALGLFLSYPGATIAPARLAQDALTMAVTYDLPATYDAHYLTLAQHLGCNLWTGDRRLLNQLGGRLPFVRFIGDYDDDTQKRRSATCSSPRPSTWCGWPPGWPRCHARPRGTRPLPGWHQPSHNPGPYSEGSPATSL